jgi:N6-adenosine-specific RNA methylase IME4
VLPSENPLTGVTALPDSSEADRSVPTAPPDTFAELTPPYSTIVADPPWHYDYGLAGGRTPGEPMKPKPFPYSTLSVDEVCALPVGDLAAPDSVLWLWTTNRYLPESFRVLAAWGFTYKQTLVWGKNNPMPLGSVAPSGTEFLLAAKRGSPQMERVWPNSVLVTPRPRARTNSVKPDAFRDLIEQSSPGPYVELFCRSPRLGWDSWGKGYEIGDAGAQRVTAKTVGQ